MRLYVPHTKPPKIKRFVVIGVRNDIGLVGLLFINTKMNPKGVNSPEIDRLQFPLSKEECDFLDHNSYLDCSQLYEWGYEKVVEGIMKDLDAPLGKLSKSQLKKVRSLVGSARTIERSKKKRYNLLPTDSNQWPPH